MSAKRVHQPDSKAASKGRVRVKDFGETGAMVNASLCTPTKS
jgi:hypothetical protein